MGRTLCMFLAMLTSCVGMAADVKSGDVKSGDQKPAPAQARRDLVTEFAAAYDKCPYAFLSRDYFARFSRDPEVKPAADEVVIADGWAIVYPDGAAPVVGTMARHLAEFLEGRMGVKVSVSARPAADLKAASGRCITLFDTGGGDAAVSESYTLAVNADRVALRGRDAAGVRAGIVHLVDAMGMRQAPFLKTGETVIKPRLAVRLGSVPVQGSIRDLVFLGYNTISVDGGNLHAMSTSNAIPELAARRQPNATAPMVKGVEQARQYGLKTYAQLNTQRKFAKDDPVFLAHPDLRGALTWKADGDYVLCTEHPLVQQYLDESIEGLFRAAPDLSGIVVIIGGEGFYHCFMRAYGVPKGHTNCPRCEALGADTVVANLCNRMAAAARRVNPDAEVIAWPYSAKHVWSSDAGQEGFIAKLKPGTGVFTEIEKDEFVDKPEGVHKSLWDYSIDLIGPGERAKSQVAACRAAGVPLYMKSEPELAFEAPRLPHLPCLDRWWDRADALATCGASGAWVMPAFRALYASSAAESYKYAWWTPIPDKEALLAQFADRIAGGKEAGALLRDAWRHTSAAIPMVPEIPAYYTGPYYLGPGQPMCADPSAEVPQVFYGQYLFMAEMTDEEGVKLRPTFVTSPTGDVPVFGRYYRKMEAELKAAYEDIVKAEPLVPERCKGVFGAEASSVRWFYHTARTEANFYESCQLRDRILATVKNAQSTPEAREAARKDLVRWKEVLLDERANTEAALPVMANDVRLDYYFGGDHTFSHGVDVLRAKLELIGKEIDEFLPSLTAKL